MKPEIDNGLVIAVLSVVLLLSAHAENKLENNFNILLIFLWFRVLQRAKRMIASDTKNTADAPNLTSRPEWRIARVPEAKAPSDLTVTHVNQTYNLWVSV